MYRRTMQLSLVSRLWNYSGVLWALVKNYRHTRHGRFHFGRLLPGSLTSSELLAALPQTPRLS